MDLAARDIIYDLPDRALPLADLFQGVKRVIQVLLRSAGLKLSSTGCCARETRQGPGVFQPFRSSCWRRVRPRISDRLFVDVVRQGVVRKGLTPMADHFAFQELD